MVLLSTVGTLNKQYMTRLVGTIGMVITWLTALVTGRDNLLSYPLTQPFIEDKVFTQKFILQTLCLYLTGIFNNTTVELEYIFKSFCA